jgi:hypothetical protein
MNSREGGWRFCHMHYTCSSLFVLGAVWFLATLFATPNLIRQVRSSWHLILDEILLSSTCYRVKNYGKIPLGIKKCCSTILLTL